MGTFLKIDTSIIALLFLTSIAFYIIRHMSKKSPAMKLLTTTTLLTVFGLITEAFSIYIMDYRIPILSDITFTFWLITDAAYLVTVYVWSTFLYTYVRENKKPGKVWNVLSLVPIVCVSILYVFNIRDGSLFYVNESNMRVIGNLYVIYALCIGVYIVLNTVVLVKHRNKLGKQEFHALLLFELIPAIGAIIQLYFPYGIYTVWIYTAYTLIMIHLYLNNTMMRYDVLTGAWKRVAFDKYTDELTKKNMDKFSLAFLDMDDFKQINDTYGHAEGDIALKKFASLATNSLGEEDILVRYGGDEFIILFNTVDMQKVEESLQRMEDSIEEFNKNNPVGYKLKYTCKAESYDKTKYNTVSELIHFVDSQMYKEKALKKKKRLILHI